MTSLNINLALSYGHADTTPFSLSVDTQLPVSGITAIFGKSGSGKTTLLRCIAGLERPNPGHVSLGEDTWQDATHFVPTHQREIGYVFQEASLLPHLTAEQNLQYTIKRARTQPSEELYAKIMGILDLASLGHRLPSQLSGGERQRFAIARAILRQPRLLLMDEPLASLDLDRKQEIMTYVLKLQAETKVPILYVTHALNEVARLADHVVVMDQGQIAAEGELAKVFSRTDLPIPGEEELSVMLTGRVIEQDPEWQLNKIEIEVGHHLWVRASNEKMNERVRLRALARDISIALSTEDNSSILNRLAVQIERIEDDQDTAFSIVHLSTGDTTLLARLTKKSVHQLNIQVGDQVWAQIKSVAVAH